MEARERVPRPDDAVVVRVPPVDVLLEDALVLVLLGPATLDGPIGVLRRRRDVGPGHVRLCELDMVDLLSNGAVLHGRVTLERRLERRARLVRAHGSFFLVVVIAVLGVEVRVAVVGVHLAVGRLKRVEEGVVGLRSWSRRIGRCGSSVRLATHPRSAEGGERRREEGRRRRSEASEVRTASLRALRRGSDTPDARESQLPGTAGPSYVQSPCAKLKCSSLCSPCAHACEARPQGPSSPCSNARLRLRAPAARRGRRKPAQSAMQRIGGEGRQGCDSGRGQEGDR